MITENFSAWTVRITSTGLSHFHVRNYKNTSIKDTDKIIEAQKCADNFFIILHYNVDFWTNALVHYLCNSKYNSLSLLMSLTVVLYTYYQYQSVLQLQQCNHNTKLVMASRKDVCLRLLDHVCSARDLDIWPQNLIYSSSSLNASKMCILWSSPKQFSIRYWHLLCIRYWLL